MSTYLPPGVGKECPRCKWVGPAAKSGRWTCLPCSRARKRHPRYAGAKNDAYRQQNLERQRRRRAWLREGDVTQQELREIFEAAGGKCHYCKTEILAPVFFPSRPQGFDHIICLAKGGRHAAANIVTCCGPCNTRKGTR